jgi:hypothetical protein
MVGTNAVVAFFPLRRSRARRNAGTVRTIMGLRDIWARSFGDGRQLALNLAGGEADHIKTDASSPSGVDDRRRPMRARIRRRANRNGKTHGAVHSIHD